MKKTTWILRSANIIQLNLQSPTQAPERKVSSQAKVPERKEKEDRMDNQMANKEGKMAGMEVDLAVKKVLEDQERDQVEEMDHHHHIKDLQEVAEMVHIKVVDLISKIVVTQKAMTNQDQEATKMVEVFMVVPVKETVGMEAVLASIGNFREQVVVTDLVTVTVMNYRSI